jgi:hypothetical protein
MALCCVSLAAAHFSIAIFIFLSSSLISPVLNQSLVFEWTDYPRYCSILRPSKIRKTLQKCFLLCSFMNATLFSFSDSDSSASLSPYFLKQLILASRKYFPCYGAETLRGFSLRCRNIRVELEPECAAEGVVRLYVKVREIREIHARSLS